MARRMVSATMGISAESVSELPCTRTATSELIFLSNSSAMLSAGVEVDCDGGVDSVPSGAVAEELDLVVESC
jgi:hypothetical protein